jgi:hypothetical protein
LGRLYTIISLVPGRFERKIIVMDYAKRPVAVEAHIAQPAHIKATLHGSARTTGQIADWPNGTHTVADQKLLRVIHRSSTK